MRREIFAGLNFIRPFGTGDWRLASGVWRPGRGPTVETVGYGRLSLRDCELAPTAARVCIIRARRTVLPFLRFPSPIGWERGQG